MPNAEVIDHQALLQRIEDLTRTVERLQAQVSTVHAEPGPDPAEATTSSRRDVFKLAGGVAAGVLAGGVVLGRAQPAAASTGQTLLLGNLQQAASITYIGNGSSATQTVGTALTSERTMFWVDNRSSTIEGVGIRGDGHGLTGAGIWGHSDSNGIGVQGDGGLGVQAQGTRAALYLIGTGAAPATRSDAHVIGEIDIDTTGNVWLCVVAGSPGTWRKIAGPASAGAFHAVNPVRAYDSRWAGGTAMASGSQRLLSVADGHDVTTGVVNAPNTVPAGATAVAYNLTVTGTVGSGFLSVAPGTASTVTASSINWSAAGQNLANGLIVGVDSSRQVRVFSGGGGSTDFLIDIVGYFL